MKCCIFLEIELTKTMAYIQWFQNNKTILFLGIDTGIQDATAAESTIPLLQPTTGNQNSVMTLSWRSDIVVLV